MKLSIVDLSVVQPGETPTQALQNSLLLAEIADELGYERIWFAEHHAKSLVGRAPEVLIAAAAERTVRIRLGSGAVLLNHYSALRVAETYCTLNELNPGRIDLGVGRATTGPVFDLYLQQDRSKPFRPDSDEQLDELLSWLDNSFEPGTAAASAPIHTIASKPQVHLTGTSGWSARAAGLRGLRYVFASFFNPYQTRENLDSYRRQFTASSDPRGIATPEARLGLHVVCNDSEVEARRQIAPVEVAYRYLAQGKLQFTEPSPTDAVAMLGGIPETQPYRKGSFAIPRYIVGTFDQVADQLHAISEDLLVEEFIIQDMTTDWDARRHSYEQLARLLPARDDASTIPSPRAADHAAALGRIAQRDRGEANQSVQVFARARPVLTTGDKS
jgi:luciferase family oxidoreductase group 1